MLIVQNVTAACLHEIQENILKWIDAWLTNKHQQIVIDGGTPSENQVLSGILQGTVATWSADITTT